MAATPGALFLFSTGLTHAASAILTEVTRWDHDPQEIFFGGAEVYMRPRDMARFGQVYLDDGVASGVPLLSPEWVALSTSPLVSTGSYFYGFWWWWPRRIGAFRDRSPARKPIRCSRS